MFQNDEGFSWSFATQNAAANNAYELAYETASDWEKINSGVRFRILDNLFRSVAMCVENPRNEIDNPIRYCTQPLYTEISTFMALILRGNLFKNQDKHWSWSVFSRLEEELNSRFRLDANRHPTWTEWALCSQDVGAERIVSAFISGKLSAEQAIELSGLDQSEFAVLVEDKAQARDVAAFEAYLKGEAVEDQLPFSEDASHRFKDLMCDQVE